MPRETVDPLSPCVASPYTHLHHWLVKAQNTTGNELRVECPRCRMIGTFTLLELDRWYRRRDQVSAAYWQDRRER